MRRRTNAMFTFCTGCAVIAMATSAAIADPLTCDVTFDGDNSNVWQEPNNWDGDVAPTSSDNACIPKTFTVTIDDAVVNNAVAKALWIDADATDRGKVIVDKDRTLTIHEDSYVDGTLEIWRRGQLIIAGDLTIVGRGGDIAGVQVDCCTTPLIVDNGGGEVLTISKSGSACTENDEGTNCRDESLTVHGWALEIHVTLVNDRAYVISDDPLGEIRLETNPKSGNGYWIAENGGFLNVVGIAMSGGGTWVLVDADSEINIGAFSTCTNLTGDVLIRNGIFDVDANFETTGNVVFESVGSPASVPEIKVANGKYFQAGS